MATAGTERIFNRGFGVTLVALIALAELAVRVIPSVSPQAFRIVYGNSLSMYMAVAERLGERAGSVEVLALGDSLAMTQFQPDVFANALELEGDQVFNAAYSGMSFPSQERMLRSIGPERFARLSRVVFFINPLRVARETETNTEIFRVAIPDPDGPWKEMLRTHHVAPLLDYSRLYGLSRHLTMGALRMAVSGKRGWDHLELLAPNGSVSWDGARAGAAPPVYPYRKIDALSEERLAEMRSVIELLRGVGAEVVIVPSALHSEIDPFSTREVHTRFVAALHAVADGTGSRYLPDATAGFEPPADRDFCDYGHMNRSGGAAFTRWLARLREELGLRAAS